MDQLIKSNGAGKGGDIKGQTPEASKLGEVISEYITQRVGPKQSYFSAIAEVWGELIPTKLREHCVLADFSKGQLKVTVDSPAYLYELQLRRSELLRELQRLMRGSRSTQTGDKTDAVQPIRQLKFTIG